MKRYGARRKGLVLTASATTRLATTTHAHEFAKLSSMARGRDIIRSELGAMP